VMIAFSSCTYIAAISNISKFFFHQWVVLPLSPYVFICRLQMLCLQLMVLYEQHTMQYEDKISMHGADLELHNSNLQVRTYL
jgi:hypothetical protein